MKERTFHVTTTYDEAACSALVHLMLYKLRRWPRFALISLGLVTSVAAAMIMLTEGMVTALPFLVMVLGSMLAMVGFFLKPIAVKMLMASYGRQFPRFEYTFSEGEFTVRTGELEKRYSYGYALRLLEMSGFLFLFMRDGQVYMLRQQDVTAGYANLKAFIEMQADRKMK